MQQLVRTAEMFHAEKTPPFVLALTTCLMLTLARSTAGSYGCGMFAEAPALEEALRDAGFDRNDADVFHNPAFVPSNGINNSDLAYKQPGIIPASAVRHIDVRPKRSSFAAVAQASKQARQSVFQSAAQTATLTAGLVRKAASLSQSLPLIC